jgi:hypothetical protein
MNDQPPPKVLTWFRVYLGVLCLGYAAAAALGVCFAFFPDFGAKFADGDNLIVTGWILLIGSVLLLAASALPFFLKPRPWVWTYDLVLICAGMMSACLIFGCVPLLIIWIKPQTKRYFGRSDV